jgi:hypothetical protein
MLNHWRIFQLKVVDPILQDAPHPSLREICERFGIAGEQQASNMLVTVKRRFQNVLRRRVRNLVRSDCDAEEEFREILAFLSGGSAGS